MGADFYTAPIALGLAARRGFVEVSRALLDARTSVLAPDRDLRHSLHFAALYDQKGVAELLVERGADVHALDSNETPPWQMAPLASSKLMRICGDGSVEPPPLDSPE